jgi:hypothetical protein
MALEAGVPPSETEVRLQLKKDFERLLYERLPQIA